MTNPSVLSAVCQKLGHGLEEVRLRALESVLSKLKRGFLKLSDVVCSKEFLVKLLEWFGFQPCPAQEKVLSLILQVLRQPGSENLVTQIGLRRTLLALSTIRENLTPELCPLLDDIVGLVHRANTIFVQGDGQSDSQQRSFKESKEDSPQILNTLRKDEACVLDASLQEALKENTPTHGNTESCDIKDVEPIATSNVLRHALLPWQPLISTDRHVLIAVESSLCNLDDRVQLFNTCSFITDVMMRDFPAEIFLQRPAIIMTFMRLMKTSLISGDNRLAGVIVACFLTLTNALQCRLRYHQDPNIVNQKQERLFHSEEDAGSHMSAESLLSNQENSDGRGLRRIPEWNDYVAKPSDSQGLLSSSKSSSQSHSFPPCDETDDVSSQVPTDSCASDDSSMLRLQQCSLPQFCLLTIQHVLPHIDTQLEVTTLIYRLTRLLSSCVTPQIWLAPATNVVAADIAAHLSEIFGKIGEVLMQDRCDTESRLTQLQLLTVTRDLLQNLVPLEIADRFLPRQLKSALCATLLDGPLHALFPTLHSDLRLFTQMFKNVRDVDCVKLFESTLEISVSLQSAANLLNQCDLSDGSKVIQSIEASLTSLSFHQNYKFIPLVFNSCSKFYHRWQLTEGENNTLSSILLRLVAHANLDVRRKAYFHLHQLVINGLGVQHTQQSPAESLAFLLFNTSLFIEITTHGIASSDNVVQNCAEDIILHALKGRYLLGPTHWIQFLLSLEPVLPLLQCWSDKPSALGRSIMTMLNPDIGSQLSLKIPELLKGNIRLLFSKDELVRREAMSRLIWLLTKEEEACNKLPHIATLHNCATESICLVEKSVDVFTQISEQSFYQESSLLQVLEIFRSGGLEPQILVSAISQVAAMLEDPRLHETFLSRDGLNLAIEYLFAAVDSKRFEVYPEAVIPLISILRSLCLHHTITRHQLAENVTLYYNVIRSLILFPSDLRLRINSSQLLYVLLYNDVIISASPRTLSDGFIVRGLSVPHLILCRMESPIVCQSHWRTSHFTEPLMTDVLLRHEDCRSFLATMWNLSYFKSPLSPLLWISGNPPQQVCDAQKQFSSSLSLDAKTLPILQASSMTAVCQKQLTCIQEASNHTDVIKSVNTLKSVLTLYNMLRRRPRISEANLFDTADFHQTYKSLAWRLTFRRFLIAAPASLEDQLLLIQILNFLRMHVSVSPSLGLHYKDVRWLTRHLQHTSEPLPNLFHTVAHTGYAGDNAMPQELSHLPKWKELCKELLDIISECACFEHLSIQWTESKIQCDKSCELRNKNMNKEKIRKENNPENLPEMIVISEKSCNTELDRAEGWVGEVLSSTAVDTQPAFTTSWTHVIQIIVSCLQSSDTQHFYNLAYLDWLLWALTNLTGKRGWSSALRDFELKPFFTKLLGILLELVQAFHLECGKGGSSYMGLSITRASILSLNHLFEEMLLYQGSKWENFCLEVTRKASNPTFYVPWLPSLFQSREPIVRAAALRLAAGLSQTPEGCVHVVDMLTDHPDVWTTPMCVLLDYTEASIVREQAANLLTNLVRHKIENKVLTNNSFEVPSHETLQHHLSAGSFFSELCSLLDSLCLATFCEPDHYARGISGIGLMHWSVSDGTMDSRSQDHVPTYQCVVVNTGQGPAQDQKRSPCSPSLISSVCNFLDSVQEMSGEIFTSFVKQGLPGQLMRCLNSIPPLNVDNVRSFQTYCDMLRMYARLCLVLSQCVSCDVVYCQYILQQPQIYHKLLLLLDPTSFDVDPHIVLSLRNELWTEVLWLLSTLLSAFTCDDSCKEENSHSVFHSMLIRSRGEPLCSVLLIALSGSLLTNLQRAALACVQSLLSHPASKWGQPFAVLMDNLNADFNSSLIAVEEVNMEDSIGAALCYSLLALYDVHSMQIGSADKSNSAETDWQSQRSAVGGALASVLETSVSAKEMALRKGFVELLCAQLGAIQSYLSLEPIETMKRLATRKKVCPILQDLERILGLLNSTISKNVSAKELASDVGVADIVHKLWTWCQTQPSLLLTVLRFLATLTSGCPSASHSLVLTTSVPGLGLRRTPSSQSLLHALVAIILQETEKASGTHDLTVITIAFSVLCNACHVPECRTAMTKGHLLIGVRHLHSCLSKKSKQKRAVETLWLNFLVQLSGFQEGQIVLPKVPDLLEYLVHLSDGQKKNSQLSLSILRNIAFLPINRPRLLGSGEFLHLMNKKLNTGDTNEQVAAGAALWALIANNQKGKLTVKCAGIDTQILDSLRQLAVSQRPGADFVAQLLNRVLKILRHESIATTNKIR